MFISVYFASWLSCYLQLVYKLKILFPRRRPEDALWMGIFKVARKVLN